MSEILEKGYKRGNFKKVYYVPCTDFFSLVHVCEISGKILLSLMLTGVYEDIIKMKNEL